MQVKLQPQRWMIGPGKPSGHPVCIGAGGRILATEDILFKRQTFSLGDEIEVISYEGKLVHIQKPSSLLSFSEKAAYYLPNLIS